MCVILIIFVCIFLFKYLIDLSINLLIHHFISFFDVVSVREWGSAAVWGDDFQTKSASMQDLRSLFYIRLYTDERCWSV